MLSKVDVNKLHRMINNMNLPTLNFFRMCVLKGFTPQYTQVTVGCNIARVATNVDVKCIDKNNEIVLVENKVGYAHQYKSASTGLMNAPYQDRNNSAYNQHQVQVAMTAELHRIHFPLQIVKRSVVWRYDETGVTQYKLESWAQNKAKDVIRHIKNSKFYFLFAFSVIW